jgi:sorting nexin-8
VKGDTSTFQCAHQLGKLCEHRHLVVNLIPYNQTDVKDKLSCPSEEHMTEFQRIVTSYGSFCTIRRTMGADIAGACGQLVVSKEKGTPVGDIEDGPFGNTKNVTTKAKQTKRVHRPDGNVVVDKDEKKISNNYLDNWVRPLAVATAVSAIVTVLSAAAILMQKRKR